MTESTEQSGTEADVPDENIPSAKTHPASLKKKLKKHVDALWWRCHWFYPNLIPSPHPDDKVYRNERDQQSNEETRVTEGEELRVQIIWGVELYGPAEIDQLYEGLRRLRWHGQFRNQKDGALNWIQEQRSYGWGGTFNIGYVGRQGRRGRSMFVDSYAPLPPEVDHLLVTVHQLTASLTAMRVGFVLTGEASTIYEREFDLDRVTVREQSRPKWGISILEPEHLKARAISTARQKLRNLAGHWFGENVPGFFSSLHRLERFPTAELITTKYENVLSRNVKSKGRAFFGWRRILVNASPYDVWTYEDYNGLQMTSKRLGVNDDGLHVIAALQTDALPEDEMKHIGGKEPSGYQYYCNEILGGILVHLATVEYLKETSRDLKLTRQSLKTTRAGRSNVMRPLNGIHLFFDRTIGTPAVARELAHLSKDIAWYRHDCSKFTADGWHKDDKPRDFCDELCQGVHFLATRVGEEESSIRSHFEQISSILSIRESIKAQRRMEVLTVVAVIVAVASLLTALQPRWLDPVNPWSSSVSDSADRPRSEK